MLCACSAATIEGMLQRPCCISNAAEWTGTQSPHQGLHDGGMPAQVLYLDGDSLGLDDPLELRWHLEEMHRRSAVWGLAEEAAAGPNWYTKGGWHPDLDCGNVIQGCLLSTQWVHNTPAWKAQDEAWSENQPADCLKVS